MRKHGLLILLGGLLGACAGGPVPQEDHPAVAARLEGGELLLQHAGKAYRGAVTATALPSRDALTRPGGEFEGHRHAPGSAAWRSGFRAWSAVLRGDAGAELECHWVSHAGHAAGECEAAGGASFHVHVQDEEDAAG